MQEDTARNILRVNLNLIAGLITIVIAFIGGVAWGVRLEDKTDQNSKQMEENKSRILLLEQGASKMDNRFSIMETTLKYIKDGIDDLKRKP